MYDMKLTALGLLLVTAGWLSAQEPRALTMQEARAAALSGLRGVSDDLQEPAPWPVLPRTPAATVSAKRLRHRPPKPALRAYEKAEKLTQGKNFPSAASELERALSLDPEFPEAHADLGAAYARLGRYPEAEAELRRAIELVPDESVPRYNLALLLFVTGRLAEAEASVRRSLQLSPDTAKASMLLEGILAKERSLTPPVSCEKSPTRTLHDSPNRAATVMERPLDSFTASQVAIRWRIISVTEVSK